MAVMDASHARRWFWPTPALLVYGAAAVTGLLYASERWRWFPANYQKGWPVLLAVAVVAAVLVLLSAWMLVALVFRRRAQFGLRTLLVFVTLCAVVCSWLAVRIKQARRQAEVLGSIRANHWSSVTYQWDFDHDGDWLHNALAPGLMPLVKFLGVDFFGDVERLFVADEHLTDAGLSRLEGLTILRYLDVLDGKVTKDRLEKIHRAAPECEIDVGRDRLY
jgi:hypothetical protein